MLPSASSTGAGLHRATEQEFITILAPCLQLVAPVGMDEGSQDMWFEAARLALADVSADHLRRGAAVAMKIADHPSKVVPAIVTEVERLRGIERSVDRVWQGADNRPSALPAPGGERATKSELDEICKRYGVGRYANDRMASCNPAAPTRVVADADPARPCRAPTREDYIRLFGIDPDANPAADQADAA